MDKIKLLTGKNPKEYEQIAVEIIDNGDVELFKELVSKDDYLFDFIKTNAASRLANACNKFNYRNLLKFLDVYSPYYEDFISSTLALFADGDVTDTMLEKLKNGSESAKVYAAAFFAYKKDERAADLLNEYAFSDNTQLCAAAARALSELKDRTAFDKALEVLNSNDSFEQMKAVNFLTAYRDKSALDELFRVMKTSALSENIAENIPYLVPLPELLRTKYNDYAVLTFCYIVSGLAELIPVSQVTNFRLYEFVEGLMKSSPSGAIAVALFWAKYKFNLLCENEEYLFDEDKTTKNEVNDIKNLLNNTDLYPLTSFLYEELYEESDFIFFALEIVRDETSLAQLLNGNNQTVIIRVMELLKAQNLLKTEYKDLALSKITDDNLKVIAHAL